MRSTGRGTSVYRWRGFEDAQNVCVVCRYYFPEYNVSQCAAKARGVWQQKESELFTLWLSSERAEGVSE